MITKIKNFLKKNESIKYYLIQVMPRAWYEQRSVGGMRITMKFVKTITRFGKTKVVEQIETFNNYHHRQHKFTYNPPYEPTEISHSDDKYYHAMWVWNDCENYPFAPITTEFLRNVIDDWFKKQNIAGGGSWK